MTREFVAGIEVGGVAPDAWGRDREVVKVSAKREDVDGNLFCVFEVRLSPTSTLLTSVKEGGPHPADLWR